VINSFRYIVDSRDIFMLQSRGGQILIIDMKIILILLEIIPNYRIRFRY